MGSARAYEPNGRDFTGIGCYQNKCAQVNNIYAKVPSNAMVPASFYGCRSDFYCRDTSICVPKMYENDPPLPQCKIKYGYGGCSSDGDCLYPAICESDRTCKIPLGNINFKLI